MRKAVKVIAILATLVSIVYFLILCIQLFKHNINWEVLISTIISKVLNLILLWALNNALERIEWLEEDTRKLYVKQEQIDLNKEVAKKNKIDK